jgi:acyl transferase domain-containing protein
MYTRFGGFIDHVREFDANFFGITPREAETMDPQQRLLLETAWEALENAGQAPDRLTDTGVGVFLGLCSFDYLQLMLGDSRFPLNGYMGSGCAHSVASGRLSHFFGVRGPCLSIDTACSSSLVSVHLACQSLRNRECGMALAGGVNLLLAPEPTIVFSKARMMSPDGRCKTFDSSANGYVRSEGCGVVILKRESDAIRNGDNILAVILGSAVNQDGRSSGLTVPNGNAQEEVLRAALANGGVQPSDVSYVEAHGTGTSLGDPIELRALGAVMGAGRDVNRPVVVGAVKTNIGHLEGAAGVAGLIKVVLALQHQEIPPNLHFRTPNPQADWQRLPVEIPTRSTSWIPINGRRVAGISSFGFSGTNAHLVVGEASSVPAITTVPDRPLHILVLSARTKAALKEVISRYEKHLAGHPEQRLQDICFTANAGRSHFAHRFSAVAADVPKMQERLQAYREGTQSLPGRLRVAFLFTGQGSQYPEMGRQLYETCPSFRASMDRCDEILKGISGHGVLEAIYGSEVSLLDETEFTQTCLLALEYSLAQLWRSWGIEPSVVLGHSLGEYAAAVVAGWFSLDDGLMLVSRRARLMQALPRTGKMLSVTASRERVEQILVEYPSTLSLAAINGRERVVVSGMADAVDELHERLQRERIHSEPVKVSHAFHSQLLDPMLEEFCGIAAETVFQSPQIPLVSNLTGKIASQGELSRYGYWSDHARRPVEFHKGIETLKERGCGVFVEIGPHPVLTSLGSECLGGYGEWLPSLRRGRPAWEPLLESLGRLYTSGALVDWKAFDGSYPRRLVHLPTYPFQRETFWKATSTAEMSLLGAAIQSPAIEGWTIFESHLSSHRPAFLNQHRIHGKAVLPAMAYLVMAASASPGLIEELVLHEPIIFDEGRSLRLQLVLREAKDNTSSFQFFSTAANEHLAAKPWRLHADGKIRSIQDSDPPPDPEFVQNVRKRCEGTSVDKVYERLQPTALDLGPVFRGLVRFQNGEDAAFGEAQLHESLVGEASFYAIHPVLLDSCLQGAGSLCLSNTASDDSLYMPSRLERIRIYCANQPTRVWFRAQGAVRSSVGQGVSIRSLQIVDSAGRVVAQCEGIHFSRLSGSTLPKPLEDDHRDWLYDVTWEPQITGNNAGNSGLPICRQIAESVRPEVAFLAHKYELETYEELLPQLESASIAYVVHALRELGLPSKPGRRLSKSVRAQYGVVPRHDRLFTRMLEMLVEEEFLRREGDEWLVNFIPDLPLPELRLRALIEKYPRSTAELELLAQCGGRLAGVLRGEIDPLEVLFPKGSQDTIERLYRDSPFLCAVHDVLERTVGQAAVSLSSGRALRILEIGAGTGSATESVLAALPRDRTDYLFTDVSSVFLSRAAEKFSAFPFMRYQVLDIEKDPAGQGLAFRKFDIIIAANVLHATQDLRQVLRHVRTLLSPGGLLLLVEGSGRQRWVDLIFGLTEGWWKFNDRELRPSYPLLTQPSWRRLLESEGFAEVEILDAQDSDGTHATHGVIVARNSITQSTAAQTAWLVLADRDGIGAGIAAAVRSQGGRVVCAFPGERFQEIRPGEFSVNPRQLEDFKALLERAGPVRVVVHLWSLDADGQDATVLQLETLVSTVCGSVLHLVQALSGADAESFPRLCLVTKGAQAVRGTAVSSTPAATLWGLGKAIALEHPDLRCLRLDLDASATLADSTAFVLETISSPDNESGTDDQHAVRDGTRYVARLTRASALADGQSGFNFAADATYLITGAFGGLGLTTARWMVSLGARNLVLVGRRPPSDTAREAVKALEQAGANILVVKADVAVWDEMAECFDQAASSMPPIHGIIHSAGALADGILQKQSLDSFRKVLAPKVFGAWNLHLLSRKLPLDFFVLFSSTASILGSAAQGNHSAANAYLDALAHFRQARGLPALSINWGVWGEIGAAARLNSDNSSDWRGLKSIPTVSGLKVLERLLSERSRAQVVVLAIDWTRFLRDFSGTMPTAFYERFVLSSSRPAAASFGTGATHLVAELQRARPADRMAIAIAHVSALAAQVIRWRTSEKMDVRQPLIEMGVDSVMAVELRNLLTATTGFTLPTTVIYEYPTLAALAGFLVDRIFPLGTAHEKHNDVATPTGETERLAEVKAMSPEAIEAELLRELDSLKY